MKRKELKARERERERKKQREKGEGGKKKKNDSRSSSSLSSLTFLDSVYSLSLFASAPAFLLERPWRPQARCVLVSSPSRERPQPSLRLGAVLGGEARERSIPLSLANFRRSLAATAAAATSRSLFPPPLNTQNNKPPTVLGPLRRSPGPGVADEVKSTELGEQKRNRKNIGPGERAQPKAKKKKNNPLKILFFTASLRRPRAPRKSTWSRSAGPPRETRR